ncbi:MAG TPA: cysteine desulfurase family protein [Candidatus Baltobacteraceae bacterium]
MNRIYLDCAATTPLREEVAAVMRAHASGAGAYNASSLHAQGRAARAILDDARATVARLIGAGAREIVFTSSGTEANNFALLGAARARRVRGAHIITAATEHLSVLRTLDALRAEGYELTILPVDGDGRIDPASFARAITSQTILASFMLANNEIGTLHPIAELAALAREPDIVMHADAVSAVGHLPIDVRALGVDLLSFAAHKFYGPKGAAGVYVREGTEIAPQLLGGAQEGGLRAGTEDVVGIAGLAAALAISLRELPETALREQQLRDCFESGVKAAFPAVRVNGAGAPRLPMISSISFPNVESATLLARLDLEGIAASAGSACASGTAKASHVIDALGAPRWARDGVVRFSLGRTTTEDDIEDVLKRLPGIVESVRGSAVPAEVWS